VSCEEIRAQLSVLSGGALRRTAIRRHLQSCEGCRSFRREVKRQRQALSMILPVVPSATLKFGAVNAIAAAGVKGGAAVGTGLAGGAGAAQVGAAGAATAAAGGGGAAGSGPLAALAGKLGLSSLGLKAATATVVVTVAAGGGAVAVREVGKPARDPLPPSSRQQQKQGSRSAGSHGPSGVRGPDSAAALSGGLLRERTRGGKASRGQRRHRPGATARGKGLGRSRTAHGRPKSNARRNAEHRNATGERGEAKRRAAKERRAERRLRRSRAVHPKKHRVRHPAHRRPSPPVGTTPVDPLPLTPPLGRTRPTVPTG
jgi:hypothetical protein